MPPGWTGVEAESVKWIPHILTLKALEDSNHVGATYLSMACMSLRLPPGVWNLVVLSC